AGKTALEGAAAGGLTIPEPGQTRLSNAGMGAAFSALPATAAAGLGLKNVIGKAVGASGKRVTERAYNMLADTLGSEKLKEIEQRVRDMPVARIPQTTAAKANDYRLGALERGARTRGYEDFGEHDIDVIKQTWARILDDTSEGAGDLSHLNRAVDDISRSGRE